MAPVPLDDGPPDGASPGTQRTIDDFDPHVVQCAFHLRAVIFGSRHANTPLGPSPSRHGESHL